jgi:hypothetical protein
VSVLYRRVWQESGFSRRDNVFTFNLPYKNFVYFLAFDSICKHDVAISCVTVLYKVSSLPSTLICYTKLFFS